MPIGSYRVRHLVAHQLIIRNPHGRQPAGHSTASAAS
jgi:hypothetical protein